MNGLSEEEVQALDGKHVGRRGIDGEHCRICDSDYPCDVRRLIDEVHRLRQILNKFRASAGERPRSVGVAGMW